MPTELADQLRRELPDNLPDRLVDLAADVFHAERAVDGLPGRPDHLIGRHVAICGTNATTSAAITTGKLCRRCRSGLTKRLADLDRVQL